MAQPRKKPESIPDPELDAIDPDPSQDTHSAYDPAALDAERVAYLDTHDAGGTMDIEDKRPPIVAFFEKIGLVKGALYEEVHVGHGRRLDFVVVEQLAGLAVDGDVDEVVITFREDGTKRQYLVRWDYITYLVPRLDR